MKTSTLLGLALTAVLVALASGAANAALVGQVSPVPGFEPDDGTALFLPNAAVVAVEGYDLFGDQSGFTSAFGFYRASDPSTLITVFSEWDQDTTGDGSDPQLAIIDFATGQVIDYDDYVLESVFGPGEESIGFFLRVVDLSSMNELTLYSEPALNTAIDGADAFASFPSSTEPGVYLLGAELPEDQGGVVLRVDLVNGVAPIPEPGSEILFIAGLAIVAVAAGVRRVSTGGDSERPVPS